MLEKRCVVCYKRNALFYPYVNTYLCDNCYFKIKNRFSETIRELMNDFNAVEGLVLKKGDFHVVKVGRLKPFIDYLKTVRGGMLIGIVRHEYYAIISVISNWFKVKAYVSIKSVLKDLIAENRGED